MFALFENIAQPNALVFFTQTAKNFPYSNMLEITVNKYWYNEWPRLGARLSSMCM